MRASAGRVDSIKRSKMFEEETEWFCELNKLPITKIHCFNSDAECLNFVARNFPDLVYDEMYERVHLMSGWTFDGRYWGLPIFVGLMMHRPVKYGTHRTVLFHELIHYRQGITNKLTYSYPYTYWEGQLVTLSMGEPWETEAYGEQNEWVKQWHIQKNKLNTSQQSTQLTRPEQQWIDWLKNTTSPAGQSLANWYPWESIKHHSVLTNWDCPSS